MRQYNDVTRPMALAALQGVALEAVGCVTVCRGYTGLHVSCNV